MKVELWYDPVYTETKTRINGMWQDETDIYSFLYPVKHYMLQTWLNESGSWRGLGSQLLDMARGEAIELCFHGRKEDYDDLCLALRNYSAINTSFAAWDTVSIYQKKLNEYLKKRTKREFPLKEEQKRLERIYQRESGETPWALEVRSKRDWTAAENSKLPCLLVSECLHCTYEELHRAERLTRSLRRPPEAICFVTKDRASMELLRDYTAQYPRMGFTFCMKDDTATMRMLKQKYGQPYQLQVNLQGMVEEEQQEMEAFLKGVEHYQQERASLFYKQQERGLSHKEQLRLKQLADVEQWVMNYQIKGRDQLKEIMELRLINTLEKT